MRKHGWIEERAPRRRAVAATLAATALLALAGSPAAQAASGIVPFPVSKGCVSADPTALCKKGTGTAGGPIVLSPDGRFAYVASYPSSAVSVFALHGGTVSQVPGAAGCVAGEGGSPKCARDDELDEPNDVVLSPDGHQAYVASGDSNEILTYDRDPATGRLRPAPGVSPVRFAAPDMLALSPDGRELYVDSLASGRIAVLDRDPADGDVHLAEEVEGCVPGPRGCRGLRAFGIVASPDGSGVYMATVEKRLRGGAQAILGFTRDPLTGSLTQVAGRGGCATDIPVRSCQRVPQLGSSAIATSPDGRNLYVASLSPGSITTFDRDPSGAIEAKPGRTICVGNRRRRDGSCSPFPLASILGLAVSPDGRKLYATGQTVLATMDRSADGTLRFAGRLRHPGFHSGEDLAFSPDGRILYDSVIHPGGLRAFSLR